MNFEPVTMSSPQAPAKPDRKGFAIGGAICGGLMLLGWCIPCIGIPLGIAGIVLSALGLRSSLKGLAIAGLVVSIIGLLLSLVNAVWGAVMALNGTHPLVPN